MASFDPYEDGIAVVLELAQPAAELDVETASQLLDEWLEPYEHADGIRYRNSMLEGDVGSRTLVLWADRVDDPEGPEAALRRAREVAQLAESRMALRATRVDSADAAAAADLQDRLGVPAFEVRQGGDVVRDWLAARESRGNARPSPILLVGLGLLAVAVLLYLIF